jgi:hypothetical protein
MSHLARDARLSHAALPEAVGGACDAAGCGVAAVPARIGPRVSLG